MMGYTLFFFSTGNDFVTFTEQNMHKVIVTAIGVVVITFFVSALRAVVSNTFIKLEQANEQLELDNRLLEEATAVDSLTGVRNRFGLRRDFFDYIESDLFVLMMDIDNFKNLNDTYGHQTGDYVLNQVGKELASIFTQDHVYRYGGDEFLLVCPKQSKDNHSAIIEKLKNQMASIDINADPEAAQSEKITISAGYSYGKPVTQGDLRLMIHQADECLYESKNAGKNCITGGKFSRQKA